MRTVDAAMCVAGLVLSLEACGTQPTAHPANAIRTISGVSLTVGGTSNPPPPSGTNGVVEAFSKSQLSGAPVAVGTTSADNGGRFVLHVPPGVYFVAAKIVAFSYPIRVDVTTASATGLRIENPIP